MRVLARQKAPPRKCGAGQNTRLKIFPLTGGKIKIRFLMKIMSSYRQVLLRILNEIRTFFKQNPEDFAD